MSHVSKNPEWSDDIIHQFCDAIKRAAKKHNLPVPILNDCEIEEHSELGEGVYGVVWTTESADCAFKLSTDSTESHFIQTAINLRKNSVDPAGIVDYRAIFALPVKRDGYEVFAIWREQATHVGLPCYINRDDTDMISFSKLAQKFYKASDLAFALAFSEQQQYGDMRQYFTWIEERVDIANQIIDGRKPKYDSPFSKILAKCYFLTIEMEATQIGKAVGNTLRTYFENGMLLCDVHADNLGWVDRSKCKELLVITDPGHNLILDRSLMDIKIQMLKE